MDNFNPQHVSLVTGASSGIGAAAAIQLARRGSRVAVHYNSTRDGAEQVARTIAGAGGEAMIVQADLRRREAAHRMVSEVMARFGRIDVLVNNAGDLLGRRPLDEIDEAFFADVMATNVGSVLWPTQAAAPHMAAQGGGVVINVCSVGARNGGGPGAACYASAKGAVLTLTKALAKSEIARGIRVCGVNPGVIVTRFHDRYSTPEQLAAFAASIPQKRTGTAADIAGAIAFLAGKDADYITGETIEINGGMWMD